MEWTMLFIMVAAAIGMIVYALMPRDENKAEIVKRRSAGLTARDDAGALRAKARDRATHHKMLEKAAPILSRPAMPKDAEEQSTLRGRLASAGFRREPAATLFLASKTAAAIAGGIIGILLAVNSGKPMLHLVGQVIMGLGLGFMLPNLWLNMAIGRRVEAVRNGMPDALDLMVVGVEAGLGLDAALQRVGDEMSNVHPELSEEMQIVTVETQMGIARAEALKKMADRTAVQEMKALVATITQAEKLGTSIASALRNQADALRTKRRQKAEERAQQTAVKLLIPLILFIFPTIFIVLAGPAAIQLMKTFGGGGVTDN